MKLLTGSFLLFSLLTLTSVTLLNPTPEGGPKYGKISGVSVVSPPNKVDDGWTQDVNGISAEWVSILPYGFSYQGKPQVNYNLSRQWWGETFSGMRALIQHAHNNDLKVMLKPMVWVMGGWVGDFEMKSEEDWLKWEKSYRGYILEAAQIAAEEKVEMICIGTEFKVASRKREKFWRQLAKDVRKIFPGAITYAANWDEYKDIRFWDAMDYIGLDAYFPLAQGKTPDVKALKAGWEDPYQKLKLLHKVYEKPILFTEFGYRSVDGCGWQQWELEGISYSSKVNLQAQINAYQAFFEQFWGEEWFAGVFLWQWYTNDARSGGERNSDYTPQNKPAEALIRSWFEKQM